MKKRILKIAAAVAALALIVCVAWFSNGLVGNPISKAMAKNTAKEHLKAHYADKDFEIDGVVFNYKFGCYYAYISSPSSIDSNFTLQLDMWGGLRHDYYEDRVLSGLNTAERISSEYRNMANGVFDSPSFPYNEHIGFGDFAFYPREYFENYSAQSYAMVTEDLILDAFYDVNELAAKAGKLTVYIDDETVSYERLSEILLGIRRTFDDAGVKFYVIDCVLEYPKNEDSSKKNDGRVEVREFLYSDIYEEGMAERVKASDEAARDYYEEQDAEKLKEKYE